MEVINRFHWIDIVFVILFARVSYIAVLRGFLNESLKLIGLLTASFFSLQYYSSFLGKPFGKKPLIFSKQCLDGISFLVIFFVIYFMFFLIGKLFSFLFWRQKRSLWERCLAVLAAGFRASFLISIIIFVFWIFLFSPKGIKESFSYKGFSKIAPWAYFGSFNIYKKVNPQIQLNEEVTNYYEGKKNLPRRGEKSIADKKEH